jgi:hypothetical protein
MLKVAIFMGRLADADQGEGSMPKLGFAVAAIVLGFSSAAFAQALTAEDQAACKADFEKYCKGTVPGGGRIIACLNKQYAELAAPCKKVLDAQKK